MQIGCGDKYENEVVQKFNKCALSVNGCVPKRIDSVMEWPVGGMPAGFGGGTSGSWIQILAAFQNHETVRARACSGALSWAPVKHGGDALGGIFDGLLSQYVPLCRCRQTMRWTRGLTSTSSRGGGTSLRA